MKSQKSIEAQIAKLQKQMKSAVRKRKGLLSGIIKSMQKHEVTLGELREAMGSSPARSAGTKKSPSGRSKVAVKYKDSTGNTWTGRGLTPKWLKAAEKAGNKREDFLVK